MKNLIRSFVKVGLRYLPFKNVILNLGAQLPHGWKGQTSTRFFAAIARRHSYQGPLKTNLGIKSNLNIQLPARVNSSILYGTPESYAGERGALLLALFLSDSTEGFFDVGANHGYFSFVLSAKTNKLPIFYFEPNRELYSEISHNVSRNSLTSIEGYEMALGKETGRAKFLLNLSDDSSSSLVDIFKDQHETEEVEIAVSSYSDFVRTKNLKKLLVKVDVEGAEFEFLEGAVAAKDTIEFLIIEILGPAMENGFVQKAKKELGMEAYYVSDFSLHRSNNDNSQYVYNPGEHNWLFCRLGPDDLAAKLKGSHFTILPE